MIYFANPSYLYFLITLPVIALIYALNRYYRRRKIARFGNPKTLAHLMPDASKYVPGLKIVLALLALAFVIIAVARPYVRIATKVNLTGDEQTVSGIEVMICCDVSNSMLASSTDNERGISRLQQSKFILEKVLDKMTNDRVGLIVFAGHAYIQLPITPDIYSAKAYVKDMSVNMVPTQGTAIGSAIDLAVNSFDPNSQFQKTILVITDGENFEDDAVKEAKKAADANIKVNVIGVGSSEPMPIPLSPGSREYLQYDGEEVKTALNETGAAEIAKAGDGVYLSGSSSDIVSDLRVQLDKLAKTEYKRTTLPSDASDLFPIAAILATILLLIDVALPYRKITWLKNIKFFSKK